MKIRKSQFGEGIFEVLLESEPKPLYTGSIVECYCYIEAFRKGYIKIDNNE